MCVSHRVKNKTPIGREWPNGTQTETDPRPNGKFFEPNREKKNKKNRNRIANSLANPTETLRPPPYPTQPAPCRTFFAFVFALWYCRCGALGPSCLKLLFMIMGPRRFGSAGVRFGGRRRIWEGRSVFALLGEAKNAKQQSNNKEKEQNENRKQKKKAKNGIIFVSDRAGRTI